MVLNVEKVYELAIFKDPTGSWSNPTVCSLPIDGNTVSTLSSYSSLQNLRRLSAAQIAYLSGHLERINQQLEAKKRQQDAAIESLTQLSKPTVPSFERVSHRPESPYHYSSYESSPRMRPVNPLPSSKDDIETPWKLEAVDFDMEPHTVRLEAEPYDDGRYRGGRRRAAANSENSRDIIIGVESYRPTKLAEIEFVAIYSRCVPSAFGSRVGSGRCQHVDQFSSFPPPASFPVSRSPPMIERIYLVKDATKKPGTEDEDGSDGMGDLEIVDRD